MHHVCRIARTATMRATPLSAGSCRSYYAPQLFSVPVPGFNMAHRLAQKPGTRCCPSSLVPSVWQCPAPTLSTMATCNAASRSSDVRQKRWESTLLTRLPGERLRFSGPRLNPATSRQSSTCRAAGSTSPTGAGEEEHHLQAQARMPVPDIRKQLDLLSQRVNQELGTSIRFKAADQNIRTDCPFCHGGSMKDASDRYSFSISTTDDSHAALYNCFRATCGKSGRVDLTGRHSSRSRRSEIPHSWDDDHGKIVLEFFAERGVNKKALEDCGVYSALVRPPVVLESEEEYAEMDEGMMQGSTASSVGGSEGQVPLVHCAVMPYRDSNGKEVSRTYMYLDAVALEEELQGRTPIQLRSPPGYAGPRLGEPTIGLETEAEKNWAFSMDQQQQQQQQHDLQAEAAEGWVSGTGHQQQRLFEPQSEGAGSGNFSEGHLEQAEIEGHTEGDAEQQHLQQGMEEGGFRGEQIQQQQQQKQQLSLQGSRNAPWQNETPGSRRNSSSSSSTAKAGTQPTHSGQASSPSPPPAKPNASEVTGVKALSREEPPASAREYFVQFFRDLRLQDRRDGDFIRFKRHKEVSISLAHFEEEITLENVHDLKKKKKLKGVGPKSVEKMTNKLREWQQSQIPDAQDSASPPAAAAAAAVAAGQGGQAVHQTATGGVGSGVGMDGKPPWEVERPGRKQASRQRESPGLTRGMSTSASSPTDSSPEPEMSGVSRRSHSASSVPPSAAGSMDMAPPYLEPAIQAVVPENQIFVDHFTLLVSLMVDKGMGAKAYEGLKKREGIYRKDLHTVAAHPEPITQDALQNLDISGLSERAITHLLRGGPNAALFFFLEQIQNQRVCTNLRNYSNKITQDEHILREVAGWKGVGKDTMRQIPRILEILQKVEAVAPSPQPQPPSVPNALTSQEYAPPQQSLQGDLGSDAGVEEALTSQSKQDQEAAPTQESLKGDYSSDAGVGEVEEGEHGSGEGRGFATGEVYRARSASLRDPVSRVHPNSAATAATTVELHFPPDEVYRAASASSHDPVSSVHPGSPAAAATAADLQPPHVATNDRWESTAAEEVYRTRSASSHDPVSTAVPPSAACSIDSAVTNVEPVQAAVPENQVFVDYFTLLVSLLMDKGLKKKAHAYQEELHNVAEHPVPITQDALKNLFLSDESQKAIGHLLGPGPNTSLCSLLEQWGNTKVPSSLQEYQFKATLEPKVLRELGKLPGVGGGTMAKILKVLETQQKVEAVACKLQPQPPSAPSALPIQSTQGQEEVALQQSLPGDPSAHAEQLGTQQQQQQQEHQEQQRPEQSVPQHDHQHHEHHEQQQQEQLGPQQQQQEHPGQHPHHTGQQCQAGVEEAALQHNLPGDLSSHAEGEKAALQQSLPGDPSSHAGIEEAERSDHGSGGSKSTASGREPHQRVHADPLAVAATAADLHPPDAATSEGGVAAELHSPDPATSAGGVEGEEFRRASAAQHLLAGLPSVWSTEAGSKRTLWGVHDVVSFLAKEEDALAQGQVREEECIEGNGKGHAPLYLYLVEDELDRLSMIMLGLPPNAVLCLPPNARRDYQSMLEEQQRQKREAVSMALPSDFLQEEQPQARRKSKSCKGSTAAGQHREGKLAGERSVLSCVTSVAESVFGDKCGRVYLALRNGPLVPGGRDDGELEDALASVLGKERCMRIRWPISPEDLPFSSPHSPDHSGTPQPLSHTTVTNSPPPPSSPSSSLPHHSITDDFGSSPSVAESISPATPDALAFPHGTGYGSATGPAFSARQAALPLRLSANEVLVADGWNALLYVVQFQVKDWPVEGLYEMKDFAETILQDYHDRRGFSQGMSTGWQYLDQFYNVVPGELTIVTGVPNSGKSEWLDALCMNLARQHGWIIAMASFEKSPKGHARNLLEKYIEKPFAKDQVDKDADGFDVPQEQMSEEELLEGMDFLDSHFLLIRHAVEDKTPIVERDPDAGPGMVESAQGLQEASPTIDWILSKADAAKKRHNICGLVIDPYNELDHSCAFERQTEYISQFLSKVKRFAQRSNVHVWLVAHPRQLHDFSLDRPPSLYDISGSAHFYNKADAGIVVHRPSASREEGGPNPMLNPVRIYVRKMRNKAAGTQGECVLYYKRSTGTYYEPDPEEQELWTS